MHQTLLESCSQLENMLEPAESCQQQAGRQGCSQQQKCVRCARPKPKTSKKKEKDKRADMNTANRGYSRSRQKQRMTCFYKKNSCI
jgi:hypothetical protein